MSEPKSLSGALRSILIVGIVAALAAVGVVLVRSNTSDSGRERNIAGGSEVAISAAPYQVALASFSLGADGKPDGGGLACGGTIIAAKWVLTADHCIWRDSAGRVYPNLVRVGAGQSDFGTSITSPTVRYGTRIFPARGVPSAWPKADLLLIEVSTPFNFGTAVRAAALPIGLDNSSWPADGTVGFITGWGKSIEDDGQAALRGVTMKLNATYHPYCTDDAAPLRAYYGNDFNPAQHLCLLRPSRDTSASACSGDSGGPFAVTIGDRTVLAGVASKAAFDPNPGVTGRARVCTGFTPNLYERVTSALDWIIPGTVVGLSGESKDGVVNVRWQAPAKAPAVAIDDYVVEFRRVGTTDWSVLNDGQSIATTASIPFLQEGIDLEVRVSGVNAVNANDTTMRQFASIVLVVGAPATTTTTSTTMPATTTTLPPYTTTIAPSTTARSIQIGPRQTTTVVATTVSAPAPPSAVPPTTVPPTVAVPGTQPAPKATDIRVVKVEAEDPGFARPTIPPAVGLQPASVTQPTTPPAPARPRPAVGIALTALQIAENVGVAVPAGATAAVVVAKGSAKVCRASGAGIAFVAKGTCKATLRIGLKPTSMKKKAIKLIVP